MDIFEEIDYYQNLLSNRNLNIEIPRNIIRDAQDPYSIDEHIFIKKYRFSQDLTKHLILPRIREYLIKPDQRGLPIAPELQILVCLRFYATASFQIVCGDLLRISQSSVSNIVSRVSYLLAQLHSQYIAYPEDMTSHRLQFSQLGQCGGWPGLQSIDGAIDCTHIKIVYTPGIRHNEAFRNRKSYFSINVQAVAGPGGKFMNIVSRWAGSTHDSRIFQLSSINMQYSQRRHSGRLVGDNGYPSLPYLLTPVNPTTWLAEERYNKAHARTRNVVERMFGMWKRRFPCLSRDLGNKLTTVSNIIVSCAVLHNIAIDAQDPLPPEEIIPYENIDDQFVGGTTDGFAVRSAIINSFYA